jgi:pantetheine-phosphate adenylyltransferase, bacterial
MKIAVCPGSFDPITKGHLDIIERASKLFDKIIVVVLSNPTKTTLFTLEERKMLAGKVLDKYPTIEVDSFDGLQADYVKKRGACAVVRGLRAITDFEYEFQMALINKRMNPEYETMFLTTSAEYLYLSSSVIKQIASFNGDISDFVPPEIHADIMEKLGRK